MPNPIYTLHVETDLEFDEDYLGTPPGTDPAGNASYDHVTPLDPDGKWFYAQNVTRSDKDNRTPVGTYDRPVFSILKREGNALSVCSGASGNPILRGGSSTRYAQGNVTVQRIIPLPQSTHPGTFSGDPTTVYCVLVIAYVESGSGGTYKRDLICFEDRIHVTEAGDEAVTSLYGWQMIEEGVAGGSAIASFGTYSAVEMDNMHVLIVYSQRAGFTAKNKQWKLCRLVRSNPPSDHATTSLGGWYASSASPIITKYEMGTGTFEADTTPLQLWPVGNNYAYGMVDEAGEYGFSSDRYRLYLFRTYPTFGAVHDIKFAPEVTSGFWLGSRRPYERVDNGSEDAASGQVIHLLGYRADTSFWGYEGTPGALMELRVTGNSSAIIDVQAKQIVTQAELDAGGVSQSFRRANFFPSIVPGTNKVQVLVSDETDLGLWTFRYHLSDLVPNGNSFPLMGEVVMDDELTQIVGSEEGNSTVSWVAGQFDMIDEDYGIVSNWWSSYGEPAYIVAHTVLARTLPPVGNMTIKPGRVWFDRL